MNKFHARRTQGLTSLTTYDSKGEMLRAEYLKQEQREGKISDLKEKPSIELVAGIKYKPDFSYVQGGRTVYEDYKGGRATMAGRFPTIVKLWRAFGPGPLLITTKTRGFWATIKTIYPEEE